MREKSGCSVDDPSLSAFEFLSLLPASTLGSVPFSINSLFLQPSVCPWSSSRIKEPGSPRWPGIRYLCHFLWALLNHGRAASFWRASRLHLVMIEDSEAGGMAFTLARALVAGVWLALVWASPTQLGRFLPAEASCGSSSAHSSSDAGLWQRLLALVIGSSGFLNPQIK